MRGYISQPGTFRLAPQAYHADPCLKPSLSASVAKILVNKTPWHAMLQHPRLNPDFDAMSSSENKRATTFGAVCHEEMLGLQEGEGSLIDILEFDAYRSNEAKASRDASIAAGRIPILVEEYKIALECVEAAKAQIDILKIYPGNTEVTVISELDGVYCRCMCDLLTLDETTIVDPKFGAFSGNETAWNKHAVGLGYDVTQGHYRTILADYLGVDVSKIQYLFLAVEAKPPYAAMLTELPIEHRDAGLEKAAYARGVFKECLARDEWPGHGDKVKQGEAVGWDLALWEMRKNDAKLAGYVSAHAPDGIETIGEWR